MKDEKEKRVNEDILQARSVVTQNESDRQVLESKSLDDDKWLARLMEPQLCGKFFKSKDDTEYVHFGEFSCHPRNGWVLYGIIVKRKGYDSTGFAGWSVREAVLKPMGVAYMMYKWDGTFMYEEVPKDDFMGNLETAVEEVRVKADMRARTIAEKVVKYDLRFERNAEASKDEEGGEE